ncbi:unnamed protein product [marine sediment metagenome]|uniref:Uncharacterized protein n=1 Tax=marine sediment metagenome TaxID=412755 RepID=X1D125_9ZZZZ
MYHCFSYNIIKGNPGGYLYSLTKAVAFNLMSVVLVDVVLVYADQSLDPKMVAHAQNPL